MAETITEKYDLDLSGFDSGLGKIIAGYDELNAKTKAAAQQNPFKKQADDLIKLNTQLRSGGDLFKKLQNNPKAYKDEVNNLTAALLKMATNQTKATQPGNWKQTQEEIKKTRAELDTLNKKYEETLAKQTKAAGKGGSGLGPRSGEGGLLSGLSGKALSGAGQLLGAFGLGVGAGEIITQIASIRAEYQRLEVQLTTTLGSKSAAAAAQQLIVDFANKTPHEIAGVTAAFTRLVDIGIVPTEKQLFQLSDVAVSKNKTVGDYVEAIADAQHGEFERLKEFSVDAAKAGDKVIFTFKGQRTEVANTSSAINDYLIGLGNVPGISGQTEAAGKTLEGRWSTLKDTFAGTANTIGTLLQPAMEGLIDVAQRGADKVKGFFDAVALVYKQKGFGAAASLFVAPFGAQARIDESVQSQKEDDYRSGATADKEDALGDVRARAAKQAADGAAAAKAAAAKAKAKKDADEAATKQKQINQEILRAKAEQVKGVQKLNEDLKKMEEKYDEERVDELNKNSSAYIEAMRRISLREIEERRQAAIKEGQERTGTPVYDLKLGKPVTLPNLNYKLPDHIESIFTKEADVVNSKSNTDFYNQQESNALVQAEQTQAFKVSALKERSAELQLELEKKTNKTELDIQRQAGESEIDYERRKQEALLQLKIEYAQKQYDLIKDDPDQKSQAEALLSAITGAKKELGDVEKAGKTGPQNIFELLNIGFQDKDAMTSPTR